jgi:phage-related minor tail protein
VSWRAEEATLYRLVAEDLIHLVEEMSARTSDPAERKELESDLDTAFETLEKADRVIEQEAAEQRRASATERWLADHQARHDHTSVYHAFGRHLLRQRIERDPGRKAVVDDILAQMVRR